MNPDQRPWTAEERVLLGTAPDAEIAAKLGRSRQAVRRERWKAKIPSDNYRRWTSAEDAIVLSVDSAEAAVLTGRTVEAVWKRRRVLRRRG